MNHLLLLSLTLSSALGRHVMPSDPLLQPPKVYSKSHTSFVAIGRTNPAPGETEVWLSGHYSTWTNKALPEE